MPVLRGGEAEIKKDKWTDHYDGKTEPALSVEIRCSDCRCARVCVAVGWDYAATDKAIELWNRRAGEDGE
jgi:hypothetical protein